MEGLVQITKITKSEIKGITSYTLYDSGEMEECRVNQYNKINTKYGQLIPFYEELGIRRKDKSSFSLYINGNLKSISLNEQTEINTTFGKFPAEFITFYESGAINSLFPLDGKLSFSWSEEEEGRLVEKFLFKTKAGDFSAKINGLRFYENGSLRSIVLWPGEIVEMNSPAGRIPVRNGFKLYENGKLESLEPAYPFEVKTPIGSIKGYDSSAIGADADKNSLRFDQMGNVMSIATTGEVNIKNKITGKTDYLASRLRIGLMDDDYVKIPLIFSFYKDKVVIDDGEKKYEWQLDETDMVIEYDCSLGISSCYGNCADCQGCS